MAALDKHGARCQCCGASAVQGAVMNVDHIKPRKTHPHLALDIDNLQVLCNECNHGKGNWNTTDWRPQSGYFYNANSARKLAHLWDGTDTLCRMWSTGGIAKNRAGWARHDERICSQCLNKRRPISG